MSMGGAKCLRNPKKTASRSPSKTGTFRIYLESVGAASSIGSNPAEQLSRMKSQ